jgi:hypothetical protein
MSYLSRPLGNGKFEVTKWGDETRPLEVYTLQDRGKRGWVCDSPGCRGRRTCKHVIIVQKRMAMPLHEVPDTLIT